MFRDWLSVDLASQGFAEKMLSLDSPRWNELQHAYGCASDIPALLRALAALPSSEGQREPWFTLWSALAHQGDVYSASFAAVPHVIRILSTAPTEADISFFGFPAWVEVCRHKTNAQVPVDLIDDYRASLAELPSLVAAAAVRDWDGGFLVCALSALSAAKGFPVVAEAALELTPEVALEFLEWFFNR